ncbi:hypothetical protein ACP70R_025064 [Stipagrostis hirtigluma subsp. patula]
MDAGELLPEDVLADVLRRLAPRCLAASRCVSRAWRAAVDGRGLLRADLLPLSLGGIFINTDETWMSWLLSRPTSGPAVSADLSYAFPADDICDSFRVRDHCNGLLLLQDRVVVNPATRRWARLPPWPPPSMGAGYFYTEEYLAFDPAVSPHYEVFSIPRLRRKPRRPDDEPKGEGSHVPIKKLDPELEELEWPPMACVLHVFSSTTGRWEERSFARRGEAAGTIADMRNDTFIDHRDAVYWRGALYVRCQTDFVMRLSLSSGTYQLIQPPVPFEPYDFFDLSCARRLFIGKSKQGVYSVLVDEGQIEVWILNEADGQIKWVPKHLHCRLPRLQEQYKYLESNGPWMLQSIIHGESKNEAAVQEKFEWDSDDDNVLEPDNGVRSGYQRFINFLGFHPYKEVIFLNDSLKRVLAYHLNSSKIQDLGAPLDGNDCINELICIESSFPYTPCWMGDFPENN